MILLFLSANTAILMFFLNFNIKTNLHDTDIQISNDLRKGFSVYEK